MYKLVGGILGILTAIAILLIVKQVNVYGVNTGLVLLALIVAYLIFSFGIIDADEVGLLKFLGKPIKHLNSGLYVAPAGFFSVDRETGTKFQDELPADAEHIFHNEDVQIVPSGMFPPIRIKFGGPLPEELEDQALWPLLKDDPYNYAMVVEVTPVVAWRITDMVVFRQRLGTPENCRKNLTDKCIAIFGDEFAKMTPAKATLKLRETSQNLENILAEEVKDGWGIKIVDAYIKPLGFSHALNISVVGVKIADQNGKAAVIKTEAEAKSILVTAAAEQKRVLATGLATPQGSKKIKGLDGQEFEFEEIELLPDAVTRTNAEAIRALKDVKGTVVLGSGATPVIDVNKKGDS